jgi:hypothetical protein
MLDSQTKDAKADIKTGLAKFASRQDRLVDGVDSQIPLLVTESYHAIIGIQRIPLIAMESFHG